MVASILVAPFSDSKCRSFLYSIFIGVSLVCFAYFIGTTLTTKDYKERISKWPLQVIGSSSSTQQPNSDECKNQYRPRGSDTLPEGIVVQTSDLEMRHLWNSSVGKEKLKPSQSLLAVAAGIKQRELVNKMVEKFLLGGFDVMLFHYDGIVDKWSDLKWNNDVIHVSAKYQTKWWFAKRFLHPDIIAEYDYVFLWDEDLDVENFHPQSYINIIKTEGLEVSQPALDPDKSVINHPITARKKKEGFHRRFYRLKANGRCDDTSTAPPCIGWVEMMAPVFSKAAWRCTWYMIQNDLIHAWGLDRHLGYCSQGDRTKKVGIVDSEYIVHLGLPTLGVLHNHKEPSQTIENRPAMRQQSFVEMQIFHQRWKDAANNDKCWMDVYQDQQNVTN